MELLALKNDAIEPKPLVATIMRSLQEMIRRELIAGSGSVRARAPCPPAPGAAELTHYPIAFYEAVQIARNPAHKPFGDAGEKIEGYGLLEAGTMHTSIGTLYLPNPNTVGRIAA